MPRTVKGKIRIFMELKPTPSTKIDITIYMQQICNTGIHMYELNFNVELQLYS